MKALECKEKSLEKQEDLLILEKKRNLALEDDLDKKNEMIELLQNEITLLKDSITSLKCVNETFQEQIMVLNKNHNNLEEEIDTLRKSASSLKETAITSMPSASVGCARCYNHDLRSYATNLEAMEALKKENERLGTLVKYGSMKTYHSKDALYKTISTNPNKDGHGLGFSDESPMSKRVVVNGKQCLMFVREGKAPQESEESSLVSSQGPGIFG